METSYADIKKLAELVKDPDDDGSSTDDDLPRTGYAKMGPGDIGHKKTKTKMRVRVNSGGDACTGGRRQEEESLDDPKAIWSLDEVPEVPYSDDAASDPRTRPEYDIKYKQSVTSEDIFLQMGNKSVMTSSCEQMTVSVKIPGEAKADVDCNVARQHLDIRSPRYRLSLPLPHPVHPDTSTAVWSAPQETLLITLTLDREFDFVNF